MQDLREEGRPKNIDPEERKRFASTSCLHRMSTRVPTRQPETSLSTMYARGMETCDGAKRGMLATSLAFACLVATAALPLWVACCPLLLLMRALLVTPSHSEGHERDGGIFVPSAVTVGANNATPYTDIALRVRNAMHSSALAVHYFSPCTERAPC